jgi:hypothetical protein
MINDGNREAKAAFDLTEAAVYGQASHRVSRALVRTPPSSPLSAFITSDSATVEHN